jgi:N-acetylmuramate 1-kinase
MSSDDYLNSFLFKALKTNQFESYPLAGDASNRRYYRVTQNQFSYVLMQWEPFEPQNYPFLSVLQHFRSFNVHVPEVIFQDPAAGLILLEDLGDLTLERKFWESQQQESSLIFYKMAIDELIKIHHYASARPTDCTAFKVQFDTEKLAWEMNYGFDNLILGVLKYTPSTTQTVVVQKIFQSICSRLHAEPKKIAHRDYHSRNLMIKLNKVRVIDFQDARLGAVQYDLVSLLRDSYTDLSDSMCQLLIADYIEKSKTHLPKDFSMEHFQNIFELQSLQRCFKACGSFASFFYQRQDRRYLKYLSKTLKRVARTAVLFPEYKDFTNLLIDSGALEKNYDNL